MMSAFVFVQLQDVLGWDEMQDLHHRLHAVGGVKTVHFLAGPTDVIVFVDADSQDELGETLGKIRSLDGVGATDTRIVWPM